MSVAQTLRHVRYARTVVPHWRHEAPAPLVLAGGFVMGGLRQQIGNKNAPTDQLGEGVSAGQRVGQVGFEPDDRRIMSPLPV